MFPSTSATAPRFLRPFTATASPSRRAMVASAGSPSDPPPPQQSSSPAPNPNKAVRVVVKGRVQGVFFRDWTVETARSLGLSGWVRNRRDGTVEALLSGDPDKVDEMVSRRIPVGPPAAAVTAVVPSPADPVDPAQGFHRKPTA
ncbi:hypothetical protein BAE44_0013201 [Dichanthelium oligosanthes]|uniref:Acylphosphatase n=1 Tax=Dichanthelium oligosanthes TaxID=888268 RepID=A0A1E5VKX6_9POAL|nr:hypothetical protein BAE44_0013201 [Dichanthelium oligosanthes]